MWTAAVLRGAPRWGLVSCQSSRPCLSMGANLQGIKPLGSLPILRAASAWPVQAEQHPKHEAAPELKQVVLLLVVLPS